MGLHRSTRWAYSRCSRYAPEWRCEDTWGGGGHSCSRARDLRHSLRAAGTVLVAGVALVPLLLGAAVRRDRAGMRFLVVSIGLAAVLGAGLLVHLMRLYWRTGGPTRLPSVPRTPDRLGVLDTRSDMDRSHPRCRRACGTDRMHHHARRGGFPSRVVQPAGDTGRPELRLGHRRAARLRTHGVLRGASTGGIGGGCERPPASPVLVGCRRLSQYSWSRGALTS